MRPLKLTIEGLRSFRAPVAIDFEDRDRIAIVGDTGAGKSSILEAMTYALYGRTTFAGRNAELRNHQSEKMRVVFEFQVGEATWEIVRLERKGLSGAQIRRLTEPVEQVEQVRQVNDRVQRLLGLDCDAFLRTVILPQGRFARLLVEDKPTDRSAILRQVWRTDELEEAGRRAGKALDVLKEGAIRLGERASSYPENPEAHLVALREALGAAAERVQAAALTEKEALGAKAALESADVDAGLAAAVRRDLEAVDLDALEAESAPLEERARTFDERAGELERRREALDDELRALPEDDGPGEADVEAALARLEGLEDLVARARLDETSRLDQAASDAEARLQAHVSALPALENELRRAEAAERLAALRRQEPGLVEEAERARREAATAEARLAAKRRSQSAAHAAADLHPGDFCPVCASELPEGWEAPPAIGLDEAERAARAAVREAAKCDRDVASHREQIAGIGPVEAPVPLDEARQRVGEHERIAEGLEREASDAHGAAERGRDRAARAQAELTRALNGVPPAFRPLPEPEPIAEAWRAARARKETLADRQRDRDRLVRERRRNDEARAELAARRQRDLEGPLKRIHAQRGKYRDILLLAADRLGLEPVGPPELEALRSGRAAVAAAAAGLAERAGAKQAAARARFRELGGGGPDEVVASAQARAREAGYEERTARKEEERFARIAGPVRRLLDLLRDVTRKRDALAGLADALKGGQFLKWLTLRRSRNLLIHASEKLKEVSGGRYAFVEPEEPDDPWRILDADSGTPRAPASLSGGEQFLASLSLSLGMVEMMERTGGRLESFFLDEGFGSLDAGNVDVAVEALQSVAAGRMVAVISHVPAVAEQIENVLRVTREVTGSRAEWLNDQARSELAAPSAAGLAGFPT